TGNTFVDSDGDRIADSVDLCPNEQESWNKFEDRDGCPDVAPEQSRYKHDEDLDGILDKDDICPLESEDYDGDRDHDGCPDK
ncbi:MAG: thrombospondin, partial [Nitrosopumilus sp.]|nr:thrombospondin [Nitrosopumilus sp.]